MAAVEAVALASQEVATAAAEAEVALPSGPSEGSTPVALVETRLLETGATALVLLPGQSKTAIQGLSA